MIDGIRSKLATMDAASRKGAKVNDAKSPVQVADAATVELTAVRDAGGSKAPVDAGKVAAIRDAIRNNAYPVDYQKLADRMQQALDATGTPDAFHYRVFTDSAPVLEVELATRSGQGWRGKHTLTLDRHGGSMFFLGEVFVNLALPPTAPVSDHCGQCEACITACPTGAIVAPYRLDARRCISYLTIEHAGPIPEALRPLIGNRIYGCDDCQLACPWNKFAQRSALPDFDDRGTGSSPRLIELFRWSEAEFLRHTEGTAIRRIGHERWLRNLAVAMGNALAGDCREEQAHALRVALGERLGHPAELVREHVAWALRQAG